MVKNVQWNANGIGGRGREFRAVITACKPILVVVIETKAMKTRAIREAWPGAGIEEVAPLQKTWGPAPRAGVVVAVQPGLTYTITRIYNERENRTKGVIHAVAVDLPYNMRVTGAYVSPTSSDVAITNFVDCAIRNGSGRDCVIGD